MIYQPTDPDKCKTDNFGGRMFDGTQQIVKNMTIWHLIWQLLKIFLRYGNLEVYYHICGSSGEGAYDHPMNAENVEVRLTYEPKVTIW